MPQVRPSVLVAGLLTALPSGPAAPSLAACADQARTVGHADLCADLTGGDADHAVRLPNPTRYLP